MVNKLTSLSKICPHIALSFWKPKAMGLTFKDFVSQRDYVIIDGALATELESRGCNLNSSLWSAEVLMHQPELIYQVHRDYFLAGADCVITSSYQASTAGLQQKGSSLPEAKALIQKSVALAKQAGSEIKNRNSSRQCFVAGSVGPYGAFLADGSEYRGDYHLSEEEMKNFHRPRIQALVDAGVDVLACETIPSIEETQALINLLLEFPSTSYWMSFTLRDNGHLSDGTSLEDVFKILSSQQCVAVGINCIPEDAVSKALSSFSSHTSMPLIAYPNSGETYDAVSKTWSGNRAQGEQLADRVKEWHGLGAKLIGGCCRTTPADTRIINDTLKPKVGYN
jgi:homocysteine S-methyltransferase